MFKNGEAVFGFTGSFRMGQLLRHNLKLPDISVSLDTWAYTTFVDALREVLKAGGFASVSNNVESIEGNFLLGLRGRLFKVECDFQVGECNESWMAVGSGDEVALGSLWTSGQNPALLGDPEARLRLALQSAENYCTGVRGPFQIISTDYWPARMRARGVLIERRG